ncbi:unnamed protein product [Heterobilharzia americana]|nr:unnamed protein product [Heterobilharzia americana]
MTLDASVGAVIYQRRLDLSRVVRSALRCSRVPISNLVFRGYAAHVQRPAPDFCGMAVYLVLFFYPLDFTFVCPTELIAFSDRIDEFKKEGAEVVGVSTDSHFSHLAWINTPRKEGGLGGLRYPLLSDYKKQITRDYGILQEQLGAALRGLFIISPESIVRQITINDLPVGRSVDEVLRLVRAFQFTDKHGEG